MRSGPRSESRELAVERCSGVRTQREGVIGSMEAGAALAFLRGNGQPWLFVIHAVQIAASPDVVREVIRWTVSGEDECGAMPARPPIGVWVGMYRSHRAVQNGAGAGVGLAAELPAAELADELRAVSRMTPEEISDEVAGLSPEEQQEILRPFIGVPFPPDDATLRAMLEALDADAEPDGPEDEGLFNELMTSAAGQFFFRVWWPCWILYGEYPPKLLRAARLGDLASLDRLLRLDKYVLHDPGVARVIGDVLSSGAANDRRRVLNALRGRPTVAFNDASIRTGLAALISQLAFLFGSRVTAPEIQALFDGIARVRRGEAADRFLPTGETLAKAIQRKRKWPSLPRG